MTEALRRIRADNPGPFTFDGTVTYLLGTDDIVVLDPGPDVDDHIRALVHAVSDARSVTVALTHGHSDHAAGVRPFVDRLASVRGMRPAVVGAGHALAVGPDRQAVIEFDRGHLLAVPTPGHSADHLSWHWPEARALFAGDHLLGHGDTTWVGEYPGCVADYLASLERCRALDLEVIHTGHGPSLDDPADALDRFERHRTRRIERVRALRRNHPGLRGDDLFHRVYGDLVPPGLDGAARASLAALEEYVDMVRPTDVL